MLWLGWNPNDAPAVCTSIFWESNWPRIIYLQYCTLLLSPCTELEVIVPIWEFSLKSRLGVSFRVIISVFCLFFSRPLNAYPMSIFVYNMGTFLHCNAVLKRVDHKLDPFFKKKNPIHRLSSSLQIILQPSLYSSV